MIGTLLILGLLAAPPSPGTVFDRRIEQSAAAAQALQGPLDGCWTVRDGGGRRLYALAIADPPAQSDPLRAAWSDPQGGLGPVDQIERSGGRLLLSFTDVRIGSRVELSLHPAVGEHWEGWLSDAEGRRYVRLSRQ